MSNELQDLSCYKFVLDGSWSKKWKQHQNIPKHLINNETPSFYCTCGYQPSSMDDWSNHAISESRNDPR